MADLEAQHKAIATAKAMAEKAESLDDLRQAVLHICSVMMDEQTAEYAVAGIGNPPWLKD